MNPLTCADFDGFFHELHGRGGNPYDWQRRLAKRLAKPPSGEEDEPRGWPNIVDLPTGSGKTACIEIAVFALACQASWTKPDGTAPRRIFFCVNRRVIVDEAHQRAEKIAKAIWKAERDADESKPTLRRVANALRSASSIASPKLPPLDVLELRGGIYRDNRWARSSTHPTIVCTTIDQLGSRLLFRGYGVSPNAAPIQAALIAYDSLVLLDEAHISRPFLQTLEFVQRYLDPERWAKQRMGVHPMIVVPLTATPPQGVNDTNVIRLEPKDRDNTGLDKRLKASKPTKLLSVSDIIQSAVAEVEALAKGPPIAVGVIVNRVATAKAIYEQLRDKHPDTLVVLVIGSMRPIDRDRQAERLRSTVGPDRPKVATEASFVVATQCLEVGADYDFDALVTECASLDALRQRFGRLNRGGREIDAQAVILVDSGQVRQESQLDDNKPLDPIYGNALSRTWNWLIEHAEVLRVEQAASAKTTRRRPSAAQATVEIHRIDFGIDAITATLHEDDEDGRIPLTLLAPSASRNAPVMLPAYVDFWCQTSPRPTPDPEVSLFIHGPQSGEPDVQVCWRADLLEDDHLKRSDWCEIVGLLPPTAAECMTVPISRLRRWLIHNAENADQGDLLGTKDPAAAMGGSRKTKEEQRKRLDQSRAGVLWRGVRDSELIRAPDDLRPGDTVVLPVSAEGWNELGHVPAKAPIDVAEQAFQKARDRAVLRLHPTLRSLLPDLPAITELLERISDSEELLTQAELRRLLRQAVDDLGPDRHDIATICRNLCSQRFGLICERYPDERGIVLTTRRRLQSETSRYLPIADEGEDERSRTTREQPVSLADHTRHVEEEVVRTADALPFDDLSDAYRLAADLHDLGKADERFQAMLRRTNRTDAWLLSGMDSALLAKSDGMPQTPQQRREARERAGLPEGFRHEMLSVQIVEHGKMIADDDPYQPLILHLIAAHHGYARPFAPVVMDTEPPEVTLEGFTLTGSARSETPPHRIDSGIAERFWKLTRQYGWWGLAYLEAVLRLADQQASAEEDAGVFDAGTPSVEPVEAAT
jgi:CRISPR-associated endonuclease/helicase Cas3